MRTITERETDRKHLVDSIAGGDVTGDLAMATMIIELCKTLEDITEEVTEAVGELR